MLGGTELGVRLDAHHNKVVTTKLEVAQVRKIASL